MYALLEPGPVALRNVDEYFKDRGTPYAIIDSKGSIFIIMECKNLEDAYKAVRETYSRDFAELKVGSMNQALDVVIRSDNAPSKMSLHDLSKVAENRFGRTEDSSKTLSNMGRAPQAYNF